MNLLYFVKFVKINDTIITILDPDIENINGKYFTEKVKIYHRTGFISLDEKNNFLSLGIRSSVR